MLRRNSMKLLYVTASAIFLTLIVGFLFVHNANSYPGDKVIELEEERTAKDKISMLEIEKLSSVLTVENENFGGIYVNEEGENVYLLKHKGSDDEKLIKSINPNANIEYVKYSEAEIREFQNVLLKRNDLGVQIVFAQNNKIEILVSKDMYEKNKAEILSGIDESIVTVKFGSFQFVDQTATI